MLSVELEIQTPAIIFPAISMLMLAYTQRFMVISQRIRQIHQEYNQVSDDGKLKQISNLRLRMILIRWMQAMGVTAFLFCSSAILVIMEGLKFGHLLFAGSIVCLIVSLLIALWEILISTKAIEIELAHIENKLTYE